MVGYAIDCMEEDSAGRIWVASSVGSGFAFYDDADTLKCFSPSESLFAPQGSPRSRLDLLERSTWGQRNLHVWDGIAELDGDVFRRASGLSGVAVSALCVGPMLAGLHPLRESARRH
jgi:hypothetical protein